MEKKKFINLDYIVETLQGDEKFLKEFCEAAVLSFSEFKSSYSKYLLEQNETELRKAGHKIKPVAQMLNIDDLLNEYEHAKEMLSEESTESELKKSADKMDRICSCILDELNTSISNL